MRTILTLLSLITAVTARGAGGIVPPFVFPKSNTVYLAGSTVREFRTPMLAKASAVAGNTIFVGPGRYTNQNDLLKPGVHWHLFAGSLIEFHDPHVDGTKGIFDDRGGAGAKGGKTTSATATTSFANTSFIGADAGQTLALIIGGIGALLLLGFAGIIALKKL